MATIIMINPVRKEKPLLKARAVLMFNINKIHNAIHNLVLFLILSFMESIENKSFHLNVFYVINIGI